MGGWSLTFDLPDGFDDRYLGHADYGADYDGRQGGLGDVGEVGCEVGQG